MDYPQRMMDFPKVAPELTKKSMRRFALGSDAVFQDEPMRHGLSSLARTTSQARDERRERS